MQDVNNLHIIAAAEFEYAPLQAGIQTRSVSSRVQFTELGVGVFAVSQTAQSLQETLRGKDVIYIGTAGSFASFDKPKLTVAKSVSWLPTCQRHNLSYAICDKEPIHLRPFAPYAQGLPVVHAICAPNVSLTDQLPSPFSKHDCVENIELYACLASLAGCFHSFTAILGITNRVGEHSHEQWKANFRQTAELTAAYLIEKISER